jgi:HD superfamily phosphodiesterase
MRNTEDNKLERYVKKEVGKTGSICHDFSHLKRTAAGAKWFVKILGGNEKEQQFAYIAGLLHDIVRPASEKIDHAEASAIRAKRILDEFDFDKNDIKEMVQAIRDHREAREWKSALHQSVFMADKILEQMGAFIVFRRCMYTGECLDYGEYSAETIINHFDKRMKKFSRDVFPDKFSKLVDYQFGWMAEFFEALKAKEAWALRIASEFFEAARRKETLEYAIRNFPADGKEKRYKKEAMDYMDGKKFDFFEGLAT